VPIQRAAGALYHSNACGFISLVRPVRLTEHGLRDRKWSDARSRMTPLLEVHDLHVAYTSRAGKKCPALAGVSFEIQPGEILAVLGESGSGKSTLAAALLRLLPGNAETQKGAVFFEGRDLLRAKARDLERLRGARIAVIFQEPSLALHPMIRVGEQVGDVLAAHEPTTSEARRQKTLQLLSEVFPADAERIAKSYPHQLSGGQQQRVLIAQAIACGPSLIVADEPTASLDSTTQQDILGLFRTLREKLNLSLILITHNPALLAGLADRALVLYAGKVAEIGPAEQVLQYPQHPYTLALLRSVPAGLNASTKSRKSRLPVIPGEAPNLAVFRDGCRFESRCADRMEQCIKHEPEPVAVSETHAVSCFKYGG
jgi:oligopeptide/dipeptide ABC transporter ATP-binding protein